MIKLSAAEFKRYIGRYQDLAPTRAVGVTRNGRERTVLIPVDDNQRLKRCDRQALSLHDFTAEDIATLAATRAPNSAKAFDTELT